MRISFLKEGIAQSVSLNQMMTENAIDLNDAIAMNALIDAIGDSKYVLPDIDKTKTLHPLHIKPDGPQIPETLSFWFNATQIY